jgi:hypothetical protein
MIDDAARWKRIKQVFQDALERPADKRERFLHSACSDDRELRGEVESLLLAHAAAGSFAQGPAIEALPPSAAVALRDGAWAEPRLQRGARLGHYEIVSAIGKGGMGEVWQARDTTLLRDVAIKLLLEGFAQDPDRLARLEREARLLASLNHPNIATIHGLESARNRTTRPSLRARQSMFAIWSAGVWNRIRSAGGNTWATCGSRSKRHSLP